MGQCHIYIYFFFAPTSTYLYLKDFKALLCCYFLQKETNNTYTLLTNCLLMSPFISFFTIMIIHWAIQSDHLRNMKVIFKKTPTRSLESPLTFSIVQLANIWPRRITMDYLDWILFEFLSFLCFWVANLKEISNVIFHFHGIYYM